MTLKIKNEIGEEMKRIYPEKFGSEAEIFSHIHRGDRIFIHRKQSCFLRHGFLLGRE